MKNLSTIWDLDRFEDVFFANFKSIHDIMKPWLPYNYYKDEKTGNLVLEVAVAGYGKESLTVQAKNGYLRVAGNIGNEEGASYVHKGIARRNFDYTFPVQPAYEVESAELKNGILRVVIKRNKEATDSIEIKEVA